MKSGARPIKIFAEEFQRGFKPYYFFVAAFYFVISLIGILHHEMWLDETHHFLLARDSDSLRELIYNARYDGHPLLWDAMLFVLTRFSHNPFYAQLLHILISLAAVIIFLRNAPFTDFFKYLLVFGYFMLYEYNIISRNYAISVLFLFIACSLIAAEKKNYVAIFISLVILSLTHLFSLFCAFTLFMVAAFKYLKEKNIRVPRLKIAMASAIFMVILLLILWSVIPPPDHFLHQYDTDPYLSFKRIGKAFSIFFKAWYPILDFTQYHFWNTNLLVDVSKYVMVIPSALCFIIPFILFHNKPLSLFTFYFPALIITIFIYWSPIIAAERHFGFIFFLLIVSLWFSHDSMEKKFFLPGKIHRKLEQFNLRFFAPFIYSVLFIQLFSGVITYTLDVARPFSEGKAVAEYLKEHHLTDKMIAVNHQGSGPAISTYLDQKVFYPETNQMGSFCLWNINPFVIDGKEMISRIEKFNSDDMILILNDSTLNISGDLNMPVYSDSEIKIFYLTKFDKGIVRSENYRLYEVIKKSEH